MGARMPARRATLPTHRVKPHLERVGIPDDIWPSDLAGLPALLPARIQVLNLDCFDTILWRDVAKAVDMFFDLAQGSVMKQHGLSAAMRIKAERAARDRRRLLDGSSEVTLHGIYRTALPAVSEQEIAAEAHACKTYPGTRELIRAAHARMPEDIRDQRYLSYLATVAHSAQKLLALRRLRHDHARFLLQRKPDIQVTWAYLAGYCHGYPRRTCGDHSVADFAAPRSLGVLSVHLCQQDAAMHEL